MLPTPEIVQAASKFDIETSNSYQYESDIFALGLTLLEMATL